MNDTTIVLSTITTTSSINVKPFSLLKTVSEAGPVAAGREIDAGLPDNVDVNTQCIRQRDGGQSRRSADWAADRGTTAWVEMPGDGAGRVASLGTSQLLAIQSDVWAMTEVGGPGEERTER